MASRRNRYLFSANTEQKMALAFQLKCAASIGYKPKKVLDLFIGWPECHKTGVMQHELLHGLGMWHEHSRQDRDQHVTVFWENIAKGKEYNFRLSPHDKTLTLPFDYSSVLHYRAQAFSKTGNEITLLPKNYSAIGVMGQRKGMSLVSTASITIFLYTKGVFANDKSKRLVNANRRLCLLEHELQRLLCRVLIPAWVDVAKLNRLYNCPAPYYIGEDIDGVPYISEVRSTN